MSFGELVTISVTTPADPRVLRPEVEFDRAIPPSHSVIVSVERSVRDIELRAFDLPIRRIALILSSDQWTWCVELLVSDRGSAHCSPLPLRFFGYGGLGPPSRDRLVSALRATLIEVMKHEIDECLLVDGARPFDPHVEGRLV